MSQTVENQTAEDTAAALITDEQRGALRSALQQVVAQELPEAIRSVVGAIATPSTTVEGEQGAGVQEEFPAAIRSLLVESQSVRSTVPASAKKYSSLYNFSGPNGDRQAYRFGMWCLACATGMETAVKYCDNNNLAIKAFKASHLESKNEAGGFLVPEEFGNDWVDLRERYGVFRRNTRVVPMSSDTRTDPRRTGGLEAYWESEGNAPAESLKSWDRIGLTAKKKMVLAKYSSELSEDAVISIGDDLAGEITYAFELKNDQAAFNGDGTSPYGKIIGVRQRLLDTYTTTGGVGLVLASGNLYNEITLADFNNVVAALPEYAEFNAKWYCSKAFWAGVMQKLIVAAGGVTAMEVMQGVKQRMFLGYPVEVSQVMPKTAANSQIPCVFGDARLASRLGDRRQATIAFSADAAFSTDEILIRGTERNDINWHDVGDATNAGPVVGLIMAAS